MSLAKAARSVGVSSASRLHDCQTVSTAIDGVEELENIAPLVAASEQQHATDACYKGMTEPCCVQLNCILSPVGMRHADSRERKFTSVADPVPREPLTNSATNIGYPLATIDNLPSYPVYLAPCTNTAGFAADDSGCLTRANPSAGSALPMACVFVALDGLKYLLLVSLDGSVRLRYHCKTARVKYLVGLHCDSKRQTLFLASSDCVTVTDFCGQVLQQVKLRCHLDCFVNRMVGSEAVLRLLDSKNCFLLTIGKDSRELEFVADLGDDLNLLACLPESDDLVLLGDSRPGHVIKARLTSGPVTEIACYKNDRADSEQFCGLNCAAVDSLGRMFIGELTRKVVKVMSTDGTVLQTLQASAADLAVLEVSGQQLLVVASAYNRKLKVFSFTVYDAAL